MKEFFKPVLAMEGEKKEHLIMERKGKLEDLDRSFDLLFWQAQSDAARFAAAWELVQFAHEGYFYQIGIPPVRVDIMMSIKGVQFDQAWAERVETDFDGARV